MVVTRGKYRGIRLDTINDNKTRPTVQKVKEAIFNMLASYIDSESNVLDLFSGSGSLGIDCLSMNVNKVIFNDCNFQSVKVIKKNLDKIKEDHNKYEIYKLDYLLMLKKLVNNNKFDLILLDPPYHLELISSLLSLIKEYDLLVNKALICCESKYDEEIIYDDNYYLLIKEKKYGNTKISIFERK